MNRVAVLAALTLGSLVASYADTMPVGSANGDIWTHGSGKGASEPAHFWFTNPHFESFILEDQFELIAAGEAHKSEHDHGGFWRSDQAEDLHDLQQRGLHCRAESSFRCEDQIEDLELLNQGSSDSIKTADLKGTITAEGPVSPVPEPGSFGLLAIAAGSFGLSLFRKRLSSPNKRLQ